jgi:ribosome-binding factor A
MRRELAQLIQQEVQDPEVGFVSVSDVEVTRDLAHAKVYITVFEEEKAPSSIAALSRAAGYLRRRLGQEMRIRSVPELHFLHDASVETGARMDELIASAVASDRHADEED